MEIELFDSAAFTYLSEKNGNYQLFIRFLVKFLTPKIVEDEFNIFKYKTSTFLFKNNSLYTKFLYGINNTSRDDVKSKFLHSECSDVTLITNFIEATLFDNDSFKRTKSVDKLALDYEFYYLFANKVLTSPSMSDFVELALKIIATERIREFNTRIEFESKDESALGNGNLASQEHNSLTCTHIIKILNSEIDKFKISYDLSDLVTLIYLVYHEVAHTHQHEELSRKSFLSAKHLRFAKEEVAVRYLGEDYYYKNYNNFMVEKDARTKGILSTIDYFENYFSYSNTGDILSKSLPLNQFENVHIDTKNISGCGFNSIHDADFLLNLITRKAIRNKPSVLEYFPVLNTEFNLDGSTKNVITRINDKNKFIQSIKGEMIKCGLDLKNGDISYVLYYEKMKLLDKRISDLNTLYNVVFTKFFENNFEFYKTNIRILIDSAGISLNDFTLTMFGLVSQVCLYNNDEVDSLLSEVNSCLDARFLTVSKNEYYYDIKNMITSYYSGEFNAKEEAYARI